MRGWLAAVMIVATPAMAAEPARQFDLVCTAKKTIVRYRIDLERGEWCSGDCSRSFKIASAATGELILEDRRAQYRGDSESSVKVDRVTGHWSEFRSLTSASLPIVREGQCDAASFSGFPATKF